MKYINKDEVDAIIINHGNVLIEYLKAERQILNLQPIEIIQCENCKFYLDSQYLPDAGRWCHKLGDGLDMPPDGYCSYGERKEEE